MRILYVSTLWFGFEGLVLRGELTLGTMLALSAVGAGFLSPLSNLVSTAVQLQLSASYLERINDVLAAMDAQERSRLELVLSYDEDTAGGLMDLDVITVLYDRGAGFTPGPSCGLGTFHPISKEEAQALKDRPRHLEPDELPPSEPEEPKTAAESD